MIRIVLGVFVLAFVLLSGCNDKTITDLDRVAGKVAGEDWNFGKGSAFYGISEVTVTLMDMKVTASDPCGVSRPASPYIRFTIPARAGTYFIQFEDQAKSVKFYEGAASAINYTSTSGYVQIVSVGDFSVDGIIQASFDEDNDVAGAFFATTCN